MLGRRSLRLAARLWTPGLCVGPPTELPLLSSEHALLSCLSGSGTHSSSGGSGDRDGCNLSSSSGSGLGMTLSWLSSWRPFSAAAAAAVEPDGQNAADAAAELPLWRFLRRQGFSAESISRMQQATMVHKKAGGRRYPVVTGKQMNEEKLQRDLAPNIAALRAEGLDTASIEQLFEQRPKLLTSTHATFSSALVALRQLAALLPDDPRAVQAPPGATQLGVALWRYPTGGAYLLILANLGSLVERNLRLRRQLGVSNAAVAIALFQHSSALFTKFERAEVMVAHLQRLQASGALSEEQVGKLALSGALKLTPAEFDRRRQEGGASALTSISCTNPAGRQQAAAEALGELLQAADDVPGPLQLQYRQQAEVLVQRQPGLWTAGPDALRANWASLQRQGLSSSQVLEAVQLQPTLLQCNWQGEGTAKQRLLAWLQQELGLSPADFLTRHAGYASYSVATLAMRADFLRQHRPARYAETVARGAGPALSLLTNKNRLARTGCTAAQLAAFNRAWLATPAGRRWGGKPRQACRKP